MDLEFLEERKINPITPVLICGGMEGRVLVKSQPGQVEAGKSVLLTETTKENLKDEQKHRQIRPITWKIQHQSQNQKRKSCPLTLTLQKLGKVLMAVIAVMPAAGLMISLGKLVQMAGADMSMIFTVGALWRASAGPSSTTCISFAVAIGGSWAKNGPAVPLHL